MKKSLFFLLLAFVAVWAVFPSPVTAQPNPAQRGSGTYCPYCGGYLGDMNLGGYGYGPGYGMGGMGYGYGRGYGMRRGMMGYIAPYVPDKLPAPKNQEWIRKLREALALERLSYNQYTADADKYNAYMPYRIVIPQEEDHVQAIIGLFSAYGIPADGKPGPITDTKSITEAYQLCVRLERTLIPIYESLIKNAEDPQSADILRGILLQTRFHLTMFEHALSMGGRMGPGMGYGYGRGYGYGGGMMRGYGPGYGTGPGMMGGGYYGYYGPPRSPGAGPVDMKEAGKIMQQYVNATENPNLKAGNIRDAGNAFEAEVRTKDSNALVDRVLIDKQTGQIRPLR